jgi:DNA topoisomerase-1
VIRHIEDNSNESVGIDGIATTVTVGGGGEDSTNIVRIINDDISIRKGKYGDYIFYKTCKMKKPKFISMKTFQLDYYRCQLNDIISWVKTQI